MFRISQKEMYLVKISQNFAYILLFVLFLPSHLFSFDVWDLKRRKKQDGKELGYFFYPLVIPFQEWVPVMEQAEQSLTC